MAVLTTSTSSYWSDSQSLPRFRKLDRDLTVDVVVIGAGITGLTAAYLLKREGRTVAVLERGRCGGVDTSYTSAHLTTVTDWRLSELVSTLGEDHARASWDAGYAAIARIEQCIKDEQIECDFAWIPGYLHADALRPATADDVDNLRREADTAAKLGFDAQFVDRYRSSIGRAWGSTVRRACIRASTSRPSPEPSTETEVSSSITARPARCEDDPPTSCRRISHGHLRSPDRRDAQSHRGHRGLARRDTLADGAFALQHLRAWADE